MFTENNCTDILAMPDGGGIRTLKHKINSLVEDIVDADIDAWYGVTPASKSLRRVTLLTALGKAWTWFRTVHNETPYRIALRTGQVFKLNDDRKVQFKFCRYRGYINEDFTPKNPFEDKSFEVAFAEFVDRNRTRKENQQERKGKREEKLKIEKLKREQKKRKVKKKVGPGRKKKKRGEKKMRKAQIKCESELPAEGIPFALPVVKIEPAPQPVVNNIVSRQMEVFNDKRADIETFLSTL